MAAVPQISVATMREEARRVLYDIATDGGEKPSDRRQAAADLMKMLDEAPDAARKVQDLSDDDLLQIIHEARAAKNVPTLPGVAPLPTAPSNEGAEATAAGPAPGAAAPSLLQRLAGIAETAPWMNDPLLAD
jgi:hypothetical protein